MLDDGIVSGELENDAPAVSYLAAIDTRGALGSSPFIGLALEQ
jgi:hypothetical protein